MNKEPQDLEAEKEVLSAAFLANYAYDKICEELTEDAFLDSRNKSIFNAIYSLHQQKLPIDPTMVKDEIGKQKKVDYIAVFTYFMQEVIDAAISSANIEYYINILKEKALRRKLIEVTNSIRTKSYDNSMSTNDVIDSAEKEIFAVTKARKSGEFQKISTVMRNAQAEIERLSILRRENNTGVTGLPSGFTLLDKITRGFHENELIILAARPAMGKTALGLNIAVNAAKKTEKAVAIFNMEMSAEQLAMRMIASCGRIELNTIMTGIYNEDKDIMKEQWNKVNEAMSELVETNIYIEDGAGMTVQEIRARCRRLASTEKGLGLVVIDYLQLITGSAKYDGNRVQEVSEISRSLKMMAMELKVPVIALAQLSRSVETRIDKRPVMSDLRESGSIEQDADMVMFLYRQDYYDRTENEKTNISISELILGKNRSGSTGTIFLEFERSISRFNNYKKKENEERSN